MVAIHNIVVNVWCVVVSHLGISKSPSLTYFTVTELLLECHRTVITETSTVRYYIHPCMSSASPLSPSQSSDEEYNGNEEYMRDEYFDACVWEYVPGYTTEPAMSRAMAQYGYIPLIKRPRYVGKQEVERLQLEDEDWKLFTTIYEAYADPGTPSEPSDSEGGTQGGGAASKWQHPSGANRAGRRAQAGDPPTSRCRPSRAQRRTKVLSDLKGRNRALEVELQTARRLITEQEDSLARILDTWG
jgi:hypothetical protein